MAFFYFASHCVGRRVGAICALAALRGFGFAAALALCISFGSSPRAAHAGTLVNYNTQFGTIQIDLFDDLVPETVDNFLAYVNSGAYTDTLIHRSVSLNAQGQGIGVIQGGGFTFNTQTSQFDSITNSGPINLQYSRANTRGTIAMARQTQPNTATSQWFINTDDVNSAGLAPGGFSADGYAVFGWVVGTGMSTVDAIHSLSTSSVSGFTDVPVQNYTFPNPIQQQNLAFTTSATVVGTHPSFQNPFNSADVVNDGIVRVSDVHAIINDLLANGLHSVADDPFSGTSYVDANGSNTVTPSDVHLVVNALLAQNAAAAPLAAVPLAAPFAASQFASPSFATVPEPTSLSLAAVAALTLAAGAFWRRRAAFARSAR